METMKARVLREVGNLEYCDYPMPEVKPDEVLFRVRACGVCGSDIPRIFVNGTYHFPTIPGHEFSGEVVGVGDEKNKELIGTRATVFPLIPCMKCENCNNGDYEMCKSYDYLGSRSDGAYAQYVRVPVWNLVPIPDNVSFEVAAMTEPCAVAIHALRRAQIEVGDNVVIFGPGTIGMLIAQWARAWGARVLLVGTDVNNWDFIESLGFTEYCNSSRENAIEWVKKMTNGVGADIAIEAVGIPLTACNCLETEPRRDVPLEIHAGSYAQLLLGADEILEPAVRAGGNVLVVLILFEDIVHGKGLIGQDTPHPAALGRYFGGVGTLGELRNGITQVNLPSDGNLAEKLPVQTQAHGVLLEAGFLDGALSIVIPQ